MASDDNTVYLEDIEQASEKKITKTAGSSSSTTTTTACKRQRTIMDMFSSSQEKDSSDPAAKKLKPSPSRPLRASSSKATPPARLGATKLNAIPFSLSAFQDSLSESERALLQLECESMGNSWLKLLKDEIKKPYFVQLKKFLWDEGVRGVSDSLLPPKVYPPGNQRHLLVVQHPSGEDQGSYNRTRPVSQSKASSRAMFLCAPWDLHATVIEKYLPRTQGGISRLCCAKSWKLDSLGVQWCPDAQHMSDRWEQFTDKVVDVIDKYGGANLPGVNSETGFGRGVVFLAWGAWAANRVKKLSTTKHLILKSAHPSPKSADRGFFGNGHFKAANEWLEEKYGANGAVDWCSVTN